jgi:hypothetical protein
MNFFEATWDGSRTLCNEHGLELDFTAICAAVGCRLRQQRSLWAFARKIFKPAPPPRLGFPEPPNSSKTWVAIVSFMYF